MKRTLVFFVSLFVMTLSAMAGNVVLSWSSAADWQTDADKNISLTKDGYTLSLVKVSGSSAPVVNANSNDARLYSTGTFTLSSTNGNMTKVVIKVSKSGAKRLAEYAASTGTAVVDKNALTVTWTGDAAEFTLTVEGKAVNGTDSDKAAQLCFDNVTIVDASAGGDQGGGDQGGGNEPTEELQNVFTESFAAGQGDFTIEDKVLPEGLTYVWAHNNKNGTYMKASAYKNPTAYVAESWLVSPVIDLSHATACQLSVQQAANHFKNQENVLAALSVKVKEADAADWTDLTLSAWPAGTNWTFVEGTADLAAYDGKQIQVAFVYTSTAEIAGTYEVKDFAVRGKTDLISADTKWAQDEVAVLPGEDFAGNNLTTLTDGARTFTSSNNAVATVDSEGQVTIVGKGVTTITVETAETATYLASRASYKLFVIEGKGTLAEPYTVADVQYYINQKLTEKVWVKGTIFGSRNNNVNYPAGDEENVVASNIVIGSEELFVPVQLSANSDPRAALNLKDNPSLQGKDVWVYGNLETYFSMPGVKNVTDYSLEGATGISSIEAAAQGKAAVIYSIDGRRLMAPVKGVQIINGRKVIR